MKNIHVLPKNVLNQLGVDHYGKTPTKIKISEFLINKNIYITSDEEIKEGDWYLIEFNGLKITQCTSAEELISIEGRDDCKKIILTTDQDLIKDGVQAIDDEFLEWFVKNPSCEFVEVEGHIYKGQDETEYKIIIPKKNFYCGNQVDYDEQCEFQCDGCVDAKGVDYGWISPMQPYKLRESKSYSKFLSCCRSEEECYCKKEPKTGSITECIKMIIDNQLNELEELKQETLEEAASKLFGSLKTGIGAERRAIWMNGAKWQQEQDKKLYNEVFEWLAHKDYLSDEVEIIQKEFEQFKNK